MGSSDDAGPDHAAALERMAGWKFQREAPDWRVISLSGIGTWFETSSHSSGAALVRRIADLTDVNPGPGGSRPNLDLRAGGVQVWIPDETGLTAARLALAQSISAVARELRLVADPSVPQDLEWGIETLDKPILRPFWQTLLGYEDTELDDLLDPLRRDPRVWFYAAAPRPLRNRIHFDVAVPREVAEERVAAVRAIGAGEGYDPDHGNVLLTDAEGNEVDFIPAGGFGDGSETSDWRLPLWRHGVLFDR